MDTKSSIDCEKKSFEKFKRYQLANSFKKVGIILALFSFLFLFVNKYFFDSQVYRETLRYGMLLGMLLISISKEKEEDERITTLRMQSYTFAFIAGVILALIQPFINYGVDFVLGIEEAAFKDNGDFLILWVLLSVQVFSFEMLKKAYS